jgi:hypothetical protein
MNKVLGESDRNLNMIKKYHDRGFKHIWKALRYDNGNTLVSAGYGAFMAVFSADGQLVRKFGGKDAVPAEVKPFFYAGFDLAEDGNLLVANWQDHGPDNGRKGRQLLCFDGGFNYIRGWSFPEHVSSLQGVLLV